MTFDDMLTQVVDLLRREDRVAYRVLKRRFGVDGFDPKDIQKAKVMLDELKEN